MCFHKIYPNEFFKMQHLEKKKNGKGQHEWNKACIEFGLRLRKLNTPMKTKLVLFSNIMFFKFLFM